MLLQTVIAPHDFFYNLKENQDFSPWIHGVFIETPNFNINKNIVSVGIHPNTNTRIILTKHRLENIVFTLWGRSMAAFSLIDAARYIKISTIQGHPHLFKDQERAFDDLASFFEKANVT